MPALEKMDRYQTAVLWPAVVGRPDSYGQFTRSEPRELVVRWITKTAVMRDGNGNPITVDATVVVNEDVALGGSMWLGEIVDFYGTGSGAANDEATVMEVVAFNKTPSLNARNIRRTVGLKFYKNSPPGVP